MRADYIRRLIELQGELTPGDMVAIWEDRESLPDYIVEQLTREITWMGYGAPQPRPWLRMSLSANVNLYRGLGGGGPKSLLLCFCGSGNRMMVPLPSFLQHLPETDVDVIVVRDPSRHHYLQGIPGFAATLSEFVDEVARRIDLDGYTDLRCLGVSAGGAPALYAGLMLGAERALSVCGRHPSLDGTLPPSGDYDAMLAERGGPGDTRLFAFYGEENRRDRQGTRALMARLPAIQPVSIKNLAGHNALFHLLEKRELGNFFRRFLLSRTKAPAPAETTQ